MFGRTVLHSCDDWMDTVWGPRLAYVLSWGAVGFVDNMGFSLLWLIP